MNHHNKIHHRDTEARRKPIDFLSVPLCLGG